MRPSTRRCLVLSLSRPFLSQITRVVNVKVWLTANLNPEFTRPLVSLQENFFSLSLVPIQRHEANVYPREKEKEMREGHHLCLRKVQLKLPEEHLLIFRENADLGVRFFCASVDQKGRQTVSHGACS